MKSRFNLNLFISILLVSLILFSYQLKAFSQSPSEEILIEEELNQVLDSLASLKHTLKTQRAKRPVGRKIKLITKDIIRAVNSIPPETCLKQLKAAMNNFYGLTSELLAGISCGPSVLPPFLPGEDEFPFRENLTTDCLPPPEDEIFERLQIGGPFGGAFTDVNPVYEECRDVFQIDSDENEISDVCE